MSEESQRYNDTELHENIFVCDGLIGKNTTNIDFKIKKLDDHHNIDSLYSGSSVVKQFPVTPLNINKTRFILIE